MNVNTKKYESGLIILYDGWCRFCSGIIGWISRSKAGKGLNYMPLQYIEESGLFQSKTVTSQMSFEEIWVINNSQVVKGVDGILLILVEMGGVYWVVAKVLRLFPMFILDYLYKLIAKNRYRIFGKNKQCTIP